jgi:Tfp pilus assembly protein PilO
VLCLLFVTAAWLLLIGPKRAEAAELQQQTSDTQENNQTLQARIEQLKVQFAELPQRQAELAAIKRAMPEDPALPTLVRDLDAMAKRTGVTLMSLAPGEPVAQQQPVATPPAAAEETGDDAASDSGDSKDADAADGEDAAAEPATAAAPAPGTVLLSVPVNIVVVGDFFKSELFLKELQAEMTRAYLVQSLTVQSEKEGEASGGKPATKNGDVTMTISGSVFVLKTAQADPAPITAGDQ